MQFHVPYFLNIIAKFALVKAEVVLPSWPSVHFRVRCKAMQGRHHNLHLLIWSMDINSQFGADGHFKEPLDYYSFYISILLLI